MDMGFIFIKIHDCIMDYFKRIVCPAALAVILSGCVCSNGEAEISSLKNGFDNPPNEARARVWWHWMNGNITKDGIKKDLVWMKNIGLGGIQHFDASLSTPTIVEKRLIYMDEGWKDAFAYAVKTADSLGLEMAVASAPGWSSTGGPWVSPQDAMKKLVWRIMIIDGGRNVSVALPAPFRTTGAFQNGAPAGRGDAGTGHEYYEDIATLAVRLPETYRTMVESGVRITSSGGRFTVEQLSDGDLSTGAVLPAEKDRLSWIMYEFPERQTVKGITMSGLEAGVLEACDDGKSFKKVCDLRGGRTAQSTISIPPATARFFRVCIPAPKPQSSMFGMSRPALPAKGTMISELELNLVSKVNHAEDKAAFSSTAKLSLRPSPAYEGETFPSPDDVVDITSHVDGDGRLDWDAPEGRWKIFRFGWSLTGKQNHPAPAEATGLEVDKLDPDAWTRYFHAYLDMYKDASGGLMGKKGIEYVLTDSYEAEHQTWTPKMLEEFKVRRGYGMLAWMPVLTGEIIGSPEHSDRFLWDWRMNIADLYAANYDLLTAIVQKDYGMLGRYSESHEAGRAFTGDGMDVKRTSQVPMSAMWSSAPWLSRTPEGDYDRSVYVADCRESASVAHIYGQNIAAAESFTEWGGQSDDYQCSPESLKAVADLELASGINRFVIHESAHQPVDDKFPGLSLGGIGQWFHRHESWAGMAGAWADYLARSSYMLQAGKNVADILYYYGEDSNVCSEFARSPQMPAGYEWDYCSPHALLNAISSKDGMLVSAGGTRYKILLMDRNMEYVSVPVLRKMAALADDGVVICAAVPKYAASLADDKDEFDALVSDIFRSGRKNVYAGKTLSEVLHEEGIEPDIRYTGADLRFRHRTLGDTEIYWVNKPGKQYQEVECSFRTSGKKPMIWHADTGVIEEASYKSEGYRTTVTLEMVPDDAVFVVFNGKGKTEQKLAGKEETTLLTLEGPWTVEFQKGHGAPDEARFDGLMSYTESDVPGIKYFSGEATYHNTFKLDRHDGEILLDLGSVKNMAEVSVNGKQCGCAWKEPFRVNITSAVKTGENDISIKVANLWTNRLIGDEQPDCPRKVAFADVRNYRPEDALLPAGLLGPVKIICKE